MNSSGFPISLGVTFFPGNVCFPEANQEEGKHHKQANDQACDKQHKQLRISLFMSYVQLHVVIP